MCENQRHPRWKRCTVFVPIDAPSNSSHTIGNSERNKCCPQIVATATICGAHTRVRIISDNGHRAGARAVDVVRLVSTSDSKT